MIGTNEMSEINESMNNNQQAELRIITSDDLAALLPKPKKSRGLAVATISEATTPSSNRSNSSKNILNSSSIVDSSNTLESVANASEDGESSTDKSRSRGGYLCRKCNQPKKGHICSVQDLQVLQQQQRRSINEQMLRTQRSASSSSMSLPSSAIPSQLPAPPPDSPRAPAFRDMAVQVELDEACTLRELGDLGMQGVPSSYEAMSAANLSAWRAQWANLSQQPLHSIPPNQFSSSSSNSSSSSSSSVHIS